MFESVRLCVTLLQFAVVLCKRSGGVLETVLYLVVCTTQLTDTVIRREGMCLDKCVLRVVVWLYELVNPNICVFVSL